MNDIIQKEKNAFIELLRSFVNQSKPHLEGELNWDEIIRLSRIHSTEGIIGYVVMNYPDINPELVNGFRQICMQTIGIYARRADKMKGMIRCLNEHGIDHLLMKGYLVRQLYPVPELRTFGDIDFLIRPEDREKCDRMMMEMGFERGTDWEPVYSYLRKNEYYEIHTDVMEVDVSNRADYKGYFKKIWDHAVLKENHTYVPDLEYHLIYLLTHLAKHITGSGAGIRLYLDFAFYLNTYRDQIDWNHFRNELKTLEFETYVNLVFSCVEKWFGVKSPYPLNPISDEVLDDFLNLTLDGGVFGHYDEDSGLTALKKQDRDEETVSKGKTLLKKAFPSASTIESRYTYLQGNHWLLPVAWTHRFFRTLNKFDQHAKEAIQIMDADDEKVIRLKRLYKEIGL